MTSSSARAVAAAGAPIVAAPPAPPPPPAPDPDKQCLDSAFILLGGSHGITKANWKTHPIKKAFKNNGINGFLADFVPLSATHIDGLQFIGPGNQAFYLSMGHANFLKLVLAYYHDMCFRKGGLVRITTSTVDAFNHFRNEDYDPNAVIVPFGKRLKQDKKKELQDWNKSVKPVATAYKEFKNEPDHIKWIKELKTTAKSQNLGHLLDPKHVPENLDLDAKQREWLWNVLTSVVINSKAKKILDDLEDTHDTRLFVTRFEQDFAKSMTATYDQSRIATYLTSTRLKTLGWRGSQESFILHFHKQAQRHNDLCQREDEKFTDAHKTTLLNNAVSGIDGLSNVLQNHETSRRAAGITTRVSFDEYVALLSRAAQTNDQGNRLSTNPRRRSTNVHEILFDGDTQESPVYQAHVHDVDTSIEDLLAFNTNTTDHIAPRTGGTYQGGTRQGPRLARMDRKTWDSLGSNPDDQKYWDCITDEGKAKILSYAKTRATKQDTRSQRHINTHEITFDDDIEHESGDSAGCIVASTHQQSGGSATDAVVSTHGQDDPQDSKPLEANKTKTTPILKDKAKNPHARGVDINFMMADTPPRSNTSVDVNVHRVLDRLASPLSYGDVPPDEGRTLSTMTYSVNAHRVDPNDPYADVGPDEFIDYYSSDDDTMTLNTNPEHSVVPRDSTITTVSTTLQADVSALSTIPSHTSSEDASDVDNNDPYSSLRLESDFHPAATPVPANTPMMTGRFRNVPKPTPFAARIGLDENGHYGIHDHIVNPTDPYDNMNQTEFISGYTSDDDAWGPGSGEPEHKEDDVSTQRLRDPTDPLFIKGRDPPNVQGSPSKSTTVRGSPAESTTHITPTTPPSDSPIPSDSTTSSTDTTKEVMWQRITRKAMQSVTRDGNTLQRITRSYSALSIGTTRSNQARDERLSMLHTKPPARPSPRPTATLRRAPWPPSTTGAPRRVTFADAASGGTAPSSRTGRSPLQSPTPTMPARPSVSTAPVASGTPPQGEQLQPSPNTTTTNTVPHSPSDTATTVQPSPNPTDQDGGWHTPKKPKRRNRNKRKNKHNNPSGGGNSGQSGQHFH